MEQELKNINRTVEDLLWEEQDKKPQDRGRFIGMTVLMIAFLVVGWFLI